MAKKKVEQMQHNGRPCEPEAGDRKFDDGSFVVRYSDAGGGCARAYPKDLSYGATAADDS